MTNEQIEKKIAELKELQKEQKKKEQKKAREKAKKERAKNDAIISNLAREFFGMNAPISDADIIQHFTKMIDKKKREKENVNE